MLHESTAAEFSHETDDIQLTGARVADGSARGIRSTYVVVRDAASGVRPVTCGEGATSTDLGHFQTYTD